MSLFIMKNFQIRKFESFHFLFFVLALLSGIFFFTGIYPGRLVNDTVANINSGIHGTYTLIYPPFIDAVMGMLFVFDNSLFSIFLLQVFTYWLAVYLLAIYFVKRSLVWIGFFVFIIAFFPYNIYLHSTLIKDVWLQESFILFFGLIANASSKDKLKPGILFFVLVTGMIVILLRNVFIAIIPGIGLSISWLVLRTEIWEKYFVKLFFLSFLLTCLFWGFGSLFEIVVTEGKIKTLDNYTRAAGMDLLGMSIRSGHRGVTKELSRKDKKQSKRGYYRHNIYWKKNLGIGTIKLRNRLRESDGTKKLWIKEVRKEPWLYVQHRLHVFRKLFDGTGQPHTNTIQRSLATGPRGMNISKQIMVQQIKPTVVWQLYEKYEKAYFKFFKSTWWILFLSGVVSVISFLKIYQAKFLNQDLVICLLMNICAWSYFGPYLIMLGHSEVRYVYPGLSLILFSVPFFLSFINKNGFKKKGGI